MFDDPGKRLRWIEEELLEEDYDEDDDEFADDFDEDEDDLGPGYNYAVDFGRTIYEDEEDDGDRYLEVPKKKGIKGLAFLAFLEVLGILAVIGWWVRWLI